MFRALRSFAPGPRQPAVQPPPNNLTVDDVLKTKSILFDLSNLPLEIIDTIIDAAEYWPCSSVVHGSCVAHGQPFRGESSDRFVLRSLPLGFVPGHEPESQGFGDKYHFTKPEPLNDSNAPEDISEEVLEWMRSKSHAREAHPCRRIVFTIRSADQGWGGDQDRSGTYGASFTWFDAGLEKLVEIHKDYSEERPVPRFHLANPLTVSDGDVKTVKDSLTSRVFSLRTIQPVAALPETQETNQSDYVFVHPLLPDQRTVQKNRTAHRQKMTHIVTWDYTDCIKPGSEEAEMLERDGRGGETGSGELVRSLVVGDVVTLWAKARFPGWINNVEEVRVDVYWAV